MLEPVQADVRMRTHMPTQLPARTPSGKPPDRTRNGAQTYTPDGASLAHVPAPPPVEMPARILGGELPDWRSPFDRLPDLTPRELAVSGGPFPLPQPTRNERNRNV